MKVPKKLKVYISARPDVVQKMDEPSGSHLAILFSLATKGLKGRNGSIGEKNGENSELFVRIGQSGTREGLHVHRVSFTHTHCFIGCLAEYEGWRKG